MRQTFGSMGEDERSQVFWFYSICRSRFRVLFLVPRCWINDVRLFRSGRDWAAIYLKPNVLVLTIHFLEWGLDEGRAETAISEMLKLWQELREERGSDDVHVVIGMDATMPAPRGVEHITGPVVFPRSGARTVKQLSAFSVFLETLSLRLLNTWPPHPLAHARPLRSWTWRRKHGDSRSQIDYIACSPQISGEAWPVRIKRTLFKKSDHKPLVSSLTLPHAVRREPFTGMPLKGWRPLDEEAKKLYQLKCLDGAASSSLHAMEDHWLRSATEVPHSTVYRRPVETSTAPATLTSLRRAIAEAATHDARETAKNLYRRERKKRARENGTRHLQSISLERPQPSSDPVRMPGIRGLATDRTEWLASALKFAKDRFQSSDNSLEQQEHRLSCLREQEKLLKRDGHPTPNLWWYDVLEASAQAKTCKAGGPDQLVAEMIHYLPVVVILGVTEIFVHCSFTKQGTWFEAAGRICHISDWPRIVTLAHGNDIAGLLAATLPISSTSGR